MSQHPLAVSGLPSKPRNLQPSMFQILSWNGQNQLVESKFIDNNDQGTSLKQKCCNNQTQVNQLNAAYNRGQDYGSYVQVNQVNATKNIDNSLKTCCKKIPSSVVQQVYKQDKSRSPAICCQKQNFDQVKQQIINKQSLKKSRLYPKDIKHELSSYQPVNLKASRSKSAEVVQKTIKQQKRVFVQTKKQQLDQKTLQERKQRIKQFQLFTRVLPNSSFTTYYGKPVFEAYGRGTSCNNLKSYNIMPHKGDNHPKKPQSHYTALIKARQVKSKSNMPRKPVEQPIIPANHQNDQQNQQVQNMNFPLQKPDLIHNQRFATVRLQTGKKAGPPIVSRNKTKTTKPVKPKNNLQVKSAQNKQKKSKSFVQPTNDGLKYLNKRQNLIQQLEQKKLKASQLAFKVTQCYPKQWNCSDLCQSSVSNQNWETLRPAGKQKQQGDHMADIFQGKKIVNNEVNIHVKK